MSSGDPILLLTRPRPAAERFRALCEARLGRALHAIIAPVIAIEAVGGPPDLTGFGAVIFTSAQAVDRAGEGQGRLAYCVGTRTAEVAAAAGFTARASDGAADDLVAMILDERPSGPLLHLRGEMSRGDIAARLTASGCPAEERVVYRQKMQDIPADAFADLPQNSEVIAPVFSPFSAEALARTWPDQGFKLTVVAISEDAAAAAPEPAIAVHVAAQPNADAMAEQVAADYGARAAC